MKMNNIFKTTAVAAMMVASMLSTKAATTNLVQNIDFTLTFYEQGNTNLVTRHTFRNIVTTTNVTVNKVRVTTRDAIAALGTATANSFSTRAQLVYVRDVNSLSNAAAIEVRDGANVVDVSSYFAITNSHLNVHSAASSGQGKAIGLAYGLARFVLANNAASSLSLSNLFGLLPQEANLDLTLNLNGFTTTTYSSVSQNGVPFAIDAISADVSGAGVDVNGTPAVVEGTIDISGSVIKVE